MALLIALAIGANSDGSGPAGSSVPWPNCWDSGGWYGRYVVDGGLGGGGGDLAICCLSVLPGSRGVYLRLLQILDQH